MTRKCRGLPFVAVVSCLVATVAVAGQRTFVGANGTDNPACSLPAPCRTFTAAISATNSGGEVIVLDSAGYGTVTITKSVSIVAPPGIYAGISVLSGDGVTINAPGSTVVLRGLTINGQGGANGILSQAAARVRIENCVVSGMAAVGIYHHADNGEMIVLETIVRDSQDGIGLVAKYGAITLDHVRSEHNAAVGFYMAPTTAASSVRGTIADSLFAHNGTHGIWADSIAGADTFISVERSVFSENAGSGYYATAAASGAKIQSTLSRNMFTQRTPGAAAIAVLGYSPAITYASDNVFGDSVVAMTSGSASTLYANRNSGGGTIYCLDNGVVVTSGNNDVYEIDAGSCTLLSKPGQ